MNDFSDDDMRNNALTDPGFFLDLEDDDDDDVVLPSALTLHNITLEEQHLHQQQQQQALERNALPSHQPQSSSTSRLSGAAIPKLDVTALNDVSHNSAGRAPEYSAGPMSTSPMGVSRNGVSDSLLAAFHASHQNSPQNATTSPNNTAFNVYSSIEQPPLCAMKLNFRSFLNQKAVPPHIENEESTGIFVGQLPSSYSEDDIEALLKAIGNQHDHIVQVRDVKSHNRDRTCAFIMINASALDAVLDFTKRVLCDMNCVWVVDRSQAAQLPLYIQQMPRDQLRGVPKAALVLEKLTPQSRPRHGQQQQHSNAAGMVTSPNGGYGGMQPGMMNAVPPPLFFPQPGAASNNGGGGVGSSGMGRGMGQAPYVDLSGMQASSPYSGSAGYMPPPPAAAAAAGALPQFFSPNSGPISGAAGSLFGSSLGSSPSYRMQMSANGLNAAGPGGIANLEAVNQMMIAATRSRANSLSHNLNFPPPPSPSSHAEGGPAPVPTAVQLTQALPLERCSCGEQLLLSQYPDSGSCAKCKATISGREVAYWCPKGHLCVCIMCALHHNMAPESGNGANMRYAQQQSEMMHR